MESTSSHEVDEVTDLVDVPSIIAVAAESVGPLVDILRTDPAGEL